MLAVVPTAALVVRIHAEERALLASLGEEYGRFAATRASASRRVVTSRRLNSDRIHYDLGHGLPTAPNTHETAQAAMADARVA
jgi:hypothetical protein